MAVSASYPENVTLECKQGYRFSNGDRWKIISCDSSGTWIGDTSDCQGEIILYSEDGCTSPVR